MELASEKANDWEECQQKIEFKGSKGRVDQAILKLRSLVNALDMETIVIPDEETSLEFFKEL
jgi:hypothetical protein